MWLQGTWEDPFDLLVAKNLDVQSFAQGSLLGVITGD